MIQQWKSAGIFLARMFLSHSCAPPARPTAVPPKIQTFFLSKCYPGCCKLLVNFQSPEKVDSDRFCQFVVVVVVAFLEG